MRREPGPSTRSDEAREEAEELRGYLLGEIKEEIVEGRKGRSLSSSEDQELMKDLAALKEKFGKWQALGSAHVSLVDIRKQLEGLSSATEVALGVLKNMDSFTASILLDSIDGDNPMLESRDLKGNRLEGAPEAQPKVHVQLNWAAMAEEDDPLQRSPLADDEESALIENLSSFHDGIEHALRCLEPLDVGSRTDVFSGVFGGIRGQIAHEGRKLFEKHTGNEPSMTAHVNLLTALYPWVADLVDGDSSDDWFREAVTDYRAFRKGLSTQERALDSMVAEGLNSEDGLFEQASQRSFIASAKALAALHSRRYRRTKK